MLTPTIKNGIYYENNGAITVEAPEHDSVLTVGRVVVKVPKGWTVTVSNVKSPDINLVGRGFSYVEGKLDTISVKDGEGKNLIVNAGFDGSDW